MSSPGPRRRIGILSPFAATKERCRDEHRIHAERLCAVTCRAGHAAFASHVFYPLFLREDLPDDRTLGLACEHAWLEVCEEIWVWDSWGISGGMMDAIDYVNRINSSGNPAGHCSYCSGIQIKIKYFSCDEIPEWEGIE